MFKRRKGGSEPEQTTGADEAVVVDEVIAVSSDQHAGPYDVSAAPDDEIARVDLGGLRIPIVDNMQLHLEGHND